MGKQIEGQLTLSIKKKLNEITKARFDKIHGGPYQRAGIADIIGLINGRYIAIEIKTPQNKSGVTRIQQEFLDEINACGGIGFVATSFDEVREALEKHHVI